jgi:hypothetical protein
MKVREIPIEQDHETGDIQISVLRSRLNRKLTVSYGNVTFPSIQISPLQIDHKDAKEGSCNFFLFEFFSEQSNLEVLMM